MTKDLGTIGRFLFGLPFVVFGVFHFINTELIAGGVPGFIPGNPSFWVWLTGLIFIVGGVGIVSVRRIGAVSELLALQLAVFVLLVHLPKAESNMVQLLKDIALLGGALMLAQKYIDEDRPWGRLFKRR